MSAEVSTISGYVDGIPQLSTRKAQTKVRLLDGQTMVIGGLIREEEVKIMEKLPILGDIPFFGRLFQNRRETSRPQELLIFLTPQIEYADGRSSVAEKPTF
jgi:type IV pilus assembly protein PilQ